jgi:hypothetical protein|tara:strand:+ start:80 stop:988 length:909 start_codon:yes stop_codon:yes gene_type:complete
MILKQGLKSTKENDEKVISKLKNMSDLTWAYIAGWIDGDGYISTLKSKRGYNYRRIGIKLIDREIIEWFADLFHTSVITATEDRREDGYNRKTQYITGVSGLRARYICEQIRPYLIEKTKNAEKFLRSFKDYPIKTVPYMQHTDEEFMAWFTGYCEAEGTFNISKTCKNKINSKGEHYKYMAPPEVKFELVNTNESIIRYCKTRLEKMGFFIQKIGFRKGRHTFFGAKGTKDRRIVKKKDLFRLFLASSSAQILYRSMLPFMRCERKISKVEKSLAIVYRNKRRTKYGGKRTTVESSIVYMK